ncbi:MAG: hypothetical protein ABI155_11035 [Paralcaligenes sp.]
MHDDIIVLVVPCVTYRSLADVMFHMISQNAAGRTALLIPLLDVLTNVFACEKYEKRRGVLMHHANLVWADAQRHIGNDSDLADVSCRNSRLRRTLTDGELGVIGELGL